MGLFDLNKDKKIDGRDLFYMSEVLMGSDDEDEDIEFENEKLDALATLDIYDLDFEDLRIMDEDERNSLLEENGLDPDDFEILFDD